MTPDGDAPASYARALSQARTCAWLALLAVGITLLFQLPLFLLDTIGDVDREWWIAQWEVPGLPRFETSAVAGVAALALGILLTTAGAVAVLMRARGAHARVAPAVGLCAAAAVVAVLANFPLSFSHHWASQQSTGYTTVSAGPCFATVYGWVALSGAYVWLRHGPTLRAGPPADAD